MPDKTVDFLQKMTQPYLNTASTFPLVKAASPYVRYGTTVLGQLDAEFENRLNNSYGNQRGRLLGIALRTSTIVLLSRMLPWGVMEMAGAVLIADGLSRVKQERATNLKNSQAHKLASIASFALGLCCAGQVCLDGSLLKCGVSLTLATGFRFISSTIEKQVKAPRSEPG
jgi:hypothetical protein